ncbi:hypothetical protein CP8484711_1331B, partial [Chlamydia psittaci 84-8471/1]
GSKLRSPIRLTIYPEIKLKIIICAQERLDIRIRTIRRCSSNPNPMDKLLYFHSMRLVLTFNHSHDF